MKKFIIFIFFIPLPLFSTNSSVQEAMDKGLTYLSQNQDDIQKVGDYFYGRENSARMGKLTFTGLAYLATGSTPIAGTYSESLRKIIKEILTQQNRETGLLAIQGGDSRPMFAHALSVLFLCECLGMTPAVRENFEMRRAIKEGVDCIIRAQHPEGWWAYVPIPENSSITDEGSITVFQVEALRAAKEVGMWVPKEPIDRALSFLKKTQNPDGGLRYKLVIRSDPKLKEHDEKSKLAISAAGLCIFISAGVYETAEIKLLRQFVKDQAMDEEKLFSDEKEFFYYRILYVARALWKLGASDEESQKILSLIQDELLKTQEENGSWPSQYGSTFATSVAVLILSMPYEYSSYMIR